MTLDESEHSCAQQGAARTRKLLHPRGDMGGLAHRRVVHAQIVRDRAHHHFARVEPDADLYDDAMTTEDFVRVTSHRLLHAQRRVASPDSMILMGHGRPE